MTKTAPSSTPLPPAAQAPFPASPLPQAHDAAAGNPSAPEPNPGLAFEAEPATPAGLGLFGLTLIGGAVAAAGLALALPFLRRDEAGARAAGSKPRGSKSQNKGAKRKQGAGGQVVNT